MGARLPRAEVQPGSDPEGGAETQQQRGHAGLRVQYPARYFQGQARQEGHRAGARFRMVEQEPVLRPVPALQQLFQQQRAGVVGRAAGRRVEIAGALSRPLAARGIHPAMAAAFHQAARFVARQSAPGQIPAGASRLDLPRRRAAQRQGRAAGVRDYCWRKKVSSASSAPSRAILPGSAFRPVTAPSTSRSTSVVPIPSIST